MLNITWPMITAVIALVLSSISILYTWLQNRRQIKVNIELDFSKFKFCEDPSEIEVKLSAFNSGLRSVALINYEFLVNDQIIYFTLDDAYLNPTNRNDVLFIQPKSNNRFPHVLKEEEITVIEITACELAKVLKNKRLGKGRKSEKLKGTVKLSGQYETAKNKIHKSKAIEFDIDEWLRYWPY